MPPVVVVLTCFAVYVVGGIISFIAVWLVVEAVLALWRYSRPAPVEGLDIVLPGQP